jgi:outer membrane protein
MKLKFTKTKVTIACLILLSAVNITANAQEVITLQKAVDRALERNLTIKQAQYNEALSTEDYNQSRYNKLPAVSANPQAGYNFGRNIDPTTNQFINQRFYRKCRDKCAGNAFPGWAIAQPDHSEPYFG